MLKLFNFIFILLSYYLLATLIDSNFTFISINKQIALLHFLLLLIIRYTLPIKTLPFLLWVSFSIFCGSLTLYYLLGKNLNFIYNHQIKLVATFMGLSLYILIWLVINLFKNKDIWKD